MKAIRCTVLSLLLLGSGQVPGADHEVALGYWDDCWTFLCFEPTILTIDVGDSVTFRNLNGGLTNPRNVVADDHSFRCALGCDGEGGDGSPSNAAWSFTRTFNVPGTVVYHDERTYVSGFIVVRDTRAFAITTGITGTWYDPEQVGHGILIEILPDNRLLAWWLTFDPAGTGQSWFGGVGSYSGNTATAIPVFQASGGRWIPNFDPAAIVNKPWGTFSFTFTDCNHGRVDFASDAGYGSGSMNLTRLTQPAGSACPSGNQIAR